MKKIIKKITVSLVLLTFFMTQAMAQSATEALEIVKIQVSTVLTDLDNNKARYQNDPRLLNTMIESKMIQYFDADIMARLVMGKHWKNTTEQQKNDFVNEFKQLILRTYSTSLLDYTGAKVEYGKPTEVKRNRTKINVKVTSPTGMVYPLTLSMIYRNNQWRGYDVALDGLSVITSYRSSIGEEISRKGLQTVIDDIKQLNLRGESK